jgi:signal recognition particle receptor subunit beta
MILHACSNKFDNFNISPVETIKKCLQIHLFQISIEQLDWVIIYACIVECLFCTNSFHTFDVFCLLFLAINDRLLPYL